MNDTYRNFVNSPLGARVARSLGLPQPELLRRYRIGQREAEFGGIAAIGAGPAPSLFEVLAGVLERIGMTSVAHEQALAWLAIAQRRQLMTGRFAPVAPNASAQERVAALIFDATGIADSMQLDAAYAFFHDTLRSLGACGRIVVLGRPPERCAKPRQWTAQRALEGFVRSLGKEARHGITANLIYVGDGAEDGIEATLRFFLSPRSAYVSGQVVRVEAAAIDAVADLAKPLAGRRALVTGAARGIGAAIAQALADLGARVAGLDIEALHDTLSVTMHGIEGTAIDCDIAAPVAPQQIADALEAMGGVDIVVHNAGITNDKTIAKMSADAWQNVIAINLAAQERIDDELLSRGTLRDGGRIVAVSSIGGIAGNVGQTNYAASKAGVIGRVQCLAGALRERRIAINAVAPGFIETQMTANMPFALREAGRRMNSMSQGGEPADVAQTIAWLAHPGAAGITGQVVRVCGQSLFGA
ncbi:MAG TPA: 3-oxoacyl-ACP reductase [Trinickia sp.]|nr:3-oxoacyl-ACP reductase [Trinickia sp.]